MQGAGAAALHQAEERDEEDLRIEQMLREGVSPQAIASRESGVAGPESELLPAEIPTELTEEDFNEEELKEYILTGAEFAQRKLAMEELEKKLPPPKPGRKRKRRAAAEKEEEDDGDEEEPIPRFNQEILQRLLSEEGAEEDDFGDDASEEQKETIEEQRDDAAADDDDYSAEAEPAPPLKKRAKTKTSAKSAKRKAAPKAKH